jgi:hypothetical protein
LFVDEQKEAAIRKTCENCHVDNRTTGATDANAPQVGMVMIKHPKGPGTPFDTAEYESACVVCHMATQAVENSNQVSAAVHLWRINTDKNYDTFPTTGQFYGGTCSVHTGAVKNAPYLPVVYQSDISQTDCTNAGGTWTAVTKDRNAQTAPDGNYAQAVWVDIDLACGQCHGGGSYQITNPPKDGLLYMTKAALASTAKGMHPTGSCNLVPDATSIPRGGTLGFQATVTNNMAEVQLFKFATTITKPNGGRYPATGYLKGPVGVNLGPNGSISKHLSQYIPNTAPLGTYTYHGYVSNSGVGISDECQFNFEVTR